MKGAEPGKETLDALAAYVLSLPNGPAPFLNQDGMLRDNAQAGPEEVGSGGRSRY